jgi:hypothetical protein
VRIEPRFGRSARTRLQAARGFSVARSEDRRTGTAHERTGDSGCASHILSSARKTHFEDWAFEIVDKCPTEILRL